MVIKKIALLVGILVVTSSTLSFMCSSQETSEQAAETAIENMEEKTMNDWENPEMFGQNKEPAHCTLIPFPDRETALKRTRKASPFYLSLSGNWKFHWVKKPADRPRDFYRLDYDTGSWEEIPVPGNWQIYGYGIPIYSNVR